MQVFKKFYYIDSKLELSKILKSNFDIDLVVNHKNYLAEKI